MLERCRKEIEVATGWNRRLGELKPDMAAEVRSLLVRALFVGRVQIIIIITIGR